MPKANNLVTFGEYKGHQTITLKRNEEDKFPFSFGVAKAKLVVANLNAIKKFIEDNDSEQ
jgi:hypothetical protein